ncbi:MAG: hypothetical protein KAV87_51495 [Desulfobacteraceae bacterium]|nr:hypothetical protein [Desulfobacteraceae bacterium]
MCTIYVAEQHDQLLALWREQKASCLDLLHLDFHCDMRGMLIDRKAERAYRIWDFHGGVDEGNFLAQAVFEGYVKSVRWVHDEPGGRAYDVGTVKYESDLTALLHRFLIALRGREGVPIRYSVVSYPEWDGLAEDECLDIDWDFFASQEYSADSIQGRVEAFLGLEFHRTPKEIYVSYSPDYCHPSRSQFRCFVSGLARIFKAEVVELQAGSVNTIERSLYRKYAPAPLLRLARNIYHCTNLGFRKRGIF